MIAKFPFENLFIFEMANNHAGNVGHGLKIIRETYAACKDFSPSQNSPGFSAEGGPASGGNPGMLTQKGRSPASLRGGNAIVVSAREEAPDFSPRSFTFNFGFKLQYRHLDTFVHPDYQKRKDIKYVKRFLETRLSEADFRLLVDEIKKLGFAAICTPFDEHSVDLIEKHGFDIIKIGSCSLTDWPLLERIVKVDKPIIASTAGASLEDIDKVVMFLEHREKKFALMHCVGEYPTPGDNLQLNQIDLLKVRYPDVTLGYSTHEDPENFDAIKIAIAKGATILEKHVGIQSEIYPLNAYSATPGQIRKWLEAARQAFTICGVSGQRREFSEKEKADLRGLQRGVFAKKEIRNGEKIDTTNTFFAIPNIANQVIANEMSKYIELIATKNIQANQPILFGEVRLRNLRERVLEIMNKIRPLLIESKISLPDKLEFELSHHYGIEKFEQWGAALINCINREYCKKLIILLAGQKHPIHYHVKKEETFNILFGDITININGVEKEYHPGGMVTVERGIKHSFSSKNGAIFEEISTTSLVEDSFYQDPQIEKNPDRKTYMTFWADWLYKPIR
jgi:sialic acid synthase SpsE/quercetin dioxygenase-like cupin family protein